MPKELIKKRIALEKGIKLVADDFEILQDKILYNLNSIPTRTIPEEYISSNATTIKKRFGHLFYGALYPINGVSSKNRRYKDKSWESPQDYTEARELKGPVVWKYIGIQPQYGTRVHWADESRVFDILTEEHITLVIDGLRNRKDQIQVAKELYDIKEELEEKLELIGSNNLTNFPLDKTYPIQLLLINDSLEGTTLPYDQIPVTCSKVTLSRTDLNFKLEMSQKVEDFLKDTYNISTTSYYGGSKEISVTLPLLSGQLEVVPMDDIGWEGKFMPLNIHEPFQSSSIDAFFEKSKQAKKEALDIIEAAELKYASRLLMKGAF